jgi:hypothetical protein
LNQRLLKQLRSCFFSYFVGDKGLFVISCINIYSNQGYCAYKCGLGLYMSMVYVSAYRELSANLAGISSFFISICIPICHLFNFKASMMKWHPDPDPGSADQTLSVRVLKNPIQKLKPFSKDIKKFLQLFFSRSKSKSDFKSTSKFFTKFFFWFEI